MKYFVYLVFLIIQSFSFYAIAYDTTTLSTNEGQTEPSGGGYDPKDKKYRTGGGYDDGNYSPEDWETEKQRRIKKIDEEEKRDELNKLKNTPINELNIVQQKRKTKLLKNECKELGFKEGSKKFKDCVVELME